MSRIFRASFAWLVAAFLAAAAAGLYWQSGQQERRDRAERERIAEEQQAQHRVLETEARRKREQEIFQEEMQAQKDAEEKRRQMDIEFRQDELKRKKFIADEREPQNPLTGYQALSEERNRRDAERRQEYEDEAATQRARVDVERQRRYLEQRELDEQLARARREAAAREAAGAVPSSAAPASPPKDVSVAPPIIRNPAAPKKSS